jgi:hypothetical protein
MKVAASPQTIAGLTYPFTTYAPRLVGEPIPLGRSGPWKYNHILDFSF